LLGVHLFGINLNKLTVKNYFKKLALLFSISMVFITSCSKEESKSVPVDQIGGIIYQSQVVTVDLPGLVVSNQTYNATIDGMAIQLSKASNEKLTFLVPASISLGLKDLVIPELNNAVVHYDIKETVLTQTFTETLTPLFDNVAAFTSAEMAAEKAETLATNKAEEDSVVAETDGLFEEDADNSIDGDLALDHMDADEDDRSGEAAL
jgi:hypothetical protein